MRFSIRVAGALLAGALLVSACGGGGGSHGPAGSAGVLPITPSNPLSPSGFAWGQDIVAQLPYLGPANGGGLSLAVYVRMRDARGLVQYAQSASDPSSPNYRHWLTPLEIGDMFGASQNDYTAAAKYFASYGLHVGAWPQREALSVTGTLDQFTRAFGTTFGRYRYRGKEIVAPNGTPHFPSTVPIVAAVGMMSATPARSYFIKNNNASFFGYAPQQLQTGFDFASAARAGFNGAGINVGIIGTGPILNANGGDDDVAALHQYWNAAVGSIVQVAASPQPATAANGQTGTGAADYNPTGLAAPPPVTAPNCSPNPNGTATPDYQACNPEDGEAQLDTESTTSLAPGATTLFYLAYNPVEYCFGPNGYDIPTNGACAAGETPVQAEGLYLADDEIQQAIADDKADTLSLSYGLPENQGGGYIGTEAQPGLGPVEFASLAAEGIAVFVSSGDDGAWECFDPSTGAPLGVACPSYPATDPSVVAVGGVNIPLDEAGNPISAIAAWADNTTQGGDGSFGNNVGSGGGVSGIFSAPTWQQKTLGATQREIPDIALDADPLTGPSIFQDVAYGGAPYASGGTSAAAPEAAAQWAIVLQACKANASCAKGTGAYPYRLGNPAPLFYAIYATSTYAKGTYTPTGFTPQLDYAHVFADVIYGGNQAVPSGNAPQPTTTPSGYESGPGYDQVTGLGAPFTGHLVQAVTGTKVP